MGYGQLPTTAGEFRVGKILPPRMAGQKKVLDLWLVQNNQKPNPEDPKGKWIDDKEVWIQTTLWEKDAENALNSLKPNDLVVAIMEISSASYVNKDGATVNYIAGKLKCPLGLSIRFRSFPHHDQPKAAEPPAGKSQAAREEAGTYNPNATDDQGRYIREPAHGGLSEDEPPF